MSVWKSPVLYLGLLLVALIVSALAAPFIVDWNSYRGALEGYGAKLSGRKVVVSGPITVRLFPWPRLEATDLQVSNPVGFGEGPMLRAGKVTVNLALAALASGKIKVESIALEKPVLNLQLDSEGVGNWHFTPDISFRQSSMLANVQLDEITFANGEINLNDLRHGWARMLSSVNGVLSGAALEGPWKMRGQGVAAQIKNSAVPLDFFISTGVNKAGEPLNFGFKLSPTDGSIPSIAFDGKVQGADVEGKVIIEPVVTVDGRSNPAGLFKPLTTTAKVAAKGEQIELSAIHIVAADPKDSGTLIDGEGHIDLTQGLKAQVSLSAPHIDLDSLAGEGLWRLSDSGGVMGLINGLMQQFPESLELSGKLDVAALTFGGENLQNLSLKSSAGSGAVRIQDFTADLPGLSRMKFSGIAFPGKAAAELGGNLSFETGDARAFVNWMWPQTKEQLGRVWTGGRGRLKAQGEITWGARLFGVQNAKYELDGLPGKGSIAVSTGGAPSLDLELAADDFDLGAYVPAGFSPLSALTAMPSLLPGEEGFRKKLDLTFGRFTLNGVVANNVAVSINAASSGFEVKRLDIGSVEGAELRGNGLVLVGADGPSGEVKFALGAQRPQGFLRMLGLLPKGPDPIWVQGLGQTNLLADFTVKPGKQEPQVNASLTGTSGALKIVGTGTATDLLAKDGPSLGLSGTASSADARDVVRLLGFAPFGSEAGDGQVSITMQGQASHTMRAVVDFTGLGATAFFDGTVVPGAPFMSLSGITKLNAEKSTALLAGLGAPIAGGAGPLSVEALLSADQEGLQAANLSLNLAGQVMQGMGHISNNHNIKLDLSGGTWRMGDVAALALAPWNGVGNFPNGRFASGWPLGLTGEIAFKPSALIDPMGISLANAVLKLNSNAEGRGVSLTANGGVEFDAKLKQIGSAFGLEGSIAYPFMLSKAYAPSVKPADVAGDAIYKGTFAGEGYSPLALLRGLSGNGSMLLTGLKVNGLAPDPFYAAANAAKTGDELAKAFAGLNKGAGVAFATQGMSCEMKDGVGHCLGSKTETAEALVTFTPAFDVAEGVASGEVLLQSKSQDALPPMRWLFSGVPGEMGEKLDTNALSAKLGTALINKDMEELARIQKEQQKADAEAAQQTQDDKTKFDNFQAQRNELRLQARMIKVFQQQRALDAARAKAALDAAVLYGQSIVKEEKRRLIQRVGR